MNRLAAFTLAMLAIASLALAQNPPSGQVRGRVTDETGGALPGAAVEIRMVGGGAAQATVSNPSGDYSLAGLPPGRYQLSFSLINFGSIVRRDIDVAAGPVTVNAVMHLALNAEVTVTGKRTFTNLADVENPAENLVGIAQSASQGAITAQQLDVRPLMRTGEVLETVPGLIATQHSGEGKANQYFLRGFNLDHGTDLAQTIAGLPVNMPTHGSRPRLLGRQLHDSGAGHRACSFRRARTLPTRATSRRPVRRTSTTPRCSTAPSRTSTSAARATRGRCSRRRLESVGTPAGRPRSGAQRRSLGEPRRLSEVQRRPPLQPGRLRERVGGDRDGVPRGVEFDRSAGRTRHHRWTRRPVRRDRRDRRRPQLPVQRIDRLAARHRDDR